MAGCDFFCVKFRPSVGLRGGGWFWSKAFSKFCQQEKAAAHEQQGRVAQQQKGEGVKT